MPTASHAANGHTRSRPTISIVAALLLITLSPAAIAHGGRLNAEGCHNDNKNGGYHCHRSKAMAPSKSLQVQPRQTGSTYYQNCTAARSAGAAPVMKGDPGYGRHLDRDGDGIGCE